MIALHIFDMDETLIDSDCDVTWKEFLVAEKIAPTEALREADRFAEEYARGCMNQDEFNEFQLREVVGITPPELAELARRHFEVMVRPHIRPAAKRFVDAVETSGERRIVLSSTNRYLVAPVAEYFGIAEFYGTDLEMRSGRFTGQIAGDYLAGEGKLRFLRKFCADNALDPADVAAYGDSINDLPLLRAVGQPVAVSPSASLRKIAEQNKWRILEWRA